DLCLSTRRELRALLYPLQTSNGPLGGGAPRGRRLAPRRRNRPSPRRAGASRLVHRGAARLQRPPQRVRRGPAVVRLLLERPHHARGQVLGNVRPVGGAPPPPPRAR